MGLPAARSPQFVEALRDGHWVHVVVGDEWREILAHDPLAVSWTLTSDLPEAVRCATDLGLVLGYGWFNGDYRRAQPMDVAMTLRTLLDVSTRSPL